VGRVELLLDRPGLAVEQRPADQHLGLTVLIDVADDRQVV
jgi:hypothetical protein